MSEMTTFGLWLKRARRARDLTQEMLAEQVGCATPTLQKIEQGARRPSRELAELLLDALGAPLADRDAILRAARAPVGVETAVPAEPAPPAPPRARIPAPASPLVGRDAERADLRRILADPSCRLLTIVGPGGIGKTRMALQAVADLLDPLAPAAGLADGAAWVSLAPLTSTDQAPAAIAAALDIPLYGALAPDAQLVAAMRERQMLLALDNLEHLPDIAVLLASILGEAPGVRLLTTSRERLRLRDEQVYELGGLAFPAEGGAPAAGRHTAVQLFLERARRLDQGFALGVDNAADIARICRALAGVPLAIELAAAWVRALSCAEIADSLARDLDFLSLSDRDMAPRHRSLRAVFAHSWHALGPPERAALARLSVFRGGCRAAAAAQVAEASPRTLAALVDASLVRRSQDAGGASRYDLHELLRQYAAERLGEQDPQGETERAHRAYYAELLQAQVQDLQSGGQIAARAAIDPDRNNVRAAWERAVAARDLPVLRQMARGIATVCEDNGWFQEGARLFGQAADALDSAGLAPELLGLRGRMVSRHGYFMARCGRVAEADRRLAEAEELLRLAGDDDLGILLTHRCLVAHMLGRYADARRWGELAVELTRAQGDRFYEGLAICFLSTIAYDTGNASAADLIDAALAHWRANGSPRGLTLALCQASVAHKDRGEIGPALDLAREGARLSAASRDRWALGMALCSLGVGALEQGEVEEARYMLREGAESAIAIGEPWLQGQAVVGLGWAERAAGDHAAAAQAFVDAARIGRDTACLPVALHALLGLAALARDAGDPARARPWLLAVARHPASAHVARSIARTMLQGQPEDDGEDLMALLADRRLPPNR